MNVLKLSQELTSIGVSLSAQLKKNSAIINSSSSSDGINSLFLNNISKLIESSKRGWLFKTYNFEAIKKSLHNLMHHQETIFRDLEKVIGIHANLMELILEMQVVIISDNDEYVWSKFMEYKNILLFYSFCFTNSNDHQISLDEETVQQFLKLKNLVDYVLKTKSSVIGAITNDQAETIV